MICNNPNCKKEIKVTEKYFILAFDRPYLNLYFHQGCIIQDLDILSKIIKEQNERTSNRRSWVRRSNFRIQS